MKTSLFHLLTAKKRTYVAIDDRLWEKQWPIPIKKVSIEIRSLNSKGLDLNLRIPSAYRELESELRKLLGEQLDRGKIDFGIYIESQADQSNGLINTELATLYYQELKNSTNHGLKHRLITYH